MQRKALIGSRPRGNPGGTFGSSAADYRIGRIDLFALQHMLIDKYGMQMSIRDVASLMGRSADALRRAIGDKSIDYPWVKALRDGLVPMGRSKRLRTEVVARVLAFGDRAAQQLKSAGANSDES